MLVLLAETQKQPYVTKKGNFLLADLLLLPPHRQIAVVEVVHQEVGQT